MPESSEDQRRTFLVPEVVQTSAMDCGPAALAALLQGFGIGASYGRLREACHTDVDGTSIDTVEEIAVQLGLDAEQVMIPPDHLFLSGTPAIPAIVVVRHPGGFTHFVLAWRRTGPLVQIMDPASGRRWEGREEFLKNLYIHRMPVPADAWREYGGGEEFTAGLHERMSRAGVREADAERLLRTALADPNWPSLARLDAALRMTQALIDSGCVTGGKEGAAILEELNREESEPQTGTEGIIPDRYWSVRPTAPDNEGSEQLELRGCVLVRAKGRTTAASAEGIPDRPPLPPDLARALEAPPPRPFRLLLNTLRADGMLSPVAVLLACILAGAGVVVEAVLLRGIFDLSPLLGLRGQRIGGIAAILCFILLLLALELPLALLLYRFGRKVENRLLLAFIHKIPRLGDRYFQSRPISDMAERSHALHLLRQIPLYGGQILRLFAQFLLTTAGIIWLDPDQALIAIVGSTVILLLPFPVQPFLAERDLRMRTHRGGLARFYLDAMLGLTPIRAHGAEESVRKEHRTLLQEWERAGLNLYRGIIPATTLQSIAGTGLAFLLLFNHLERHGITGSVLLLSYWGLQLSVIGEGLSRLIQRYPAYRTITLRLLEPLGAPEEEERGETTGEQKEGKGLSRKELSPEELHTATLPPATGEKNTFSGVAIRMRNVRVEAAGQTILDNVNLEISPGEQIAVVGRSGAGKSTLIGLLAGWYHPAAGEVEADGRILTGDRLKSFRRGVVWIDPSVHLWNTSLFDNLLYGNDPDAASRIGEALHHADLFSAVERLPEGLGTQLGEGGGFLSGGEGQRVRLGRGLLRNGARLFLLDEPFRGLDRSQRQRLLDGIRQSRKEATILCVTHDVEATRSFERVLVIEEGRIVEDGSPAVLARHPDSRYGALLAGDLSAREEVWSEGTWRRLRMEGGRVMEAENMTGTNGNGKGR